VCTRGKTAGGIGRRQRGPAPTHNFTDDRRQRDTFCFAQEEEGGRVVIVGNTSYLQEKPRVIAGDDEEVRRPKRRRTSPAVVLVAGRPSIRQHRVGPDEGVADDGEKKRGRKDGGSHSRTTEDEERVTAGESHGTYDEEKRTRGRIFFLAARPIPKRSYGGGGFERASKELRKSSEDNHKTKRNVRNNFGQKRRSQ